MKPITIDRRRHLESIGLNPDDASAWAGKYSALKADAKGYGREFSLTYEQYTLIAKESGLTCPGDIGQTLDSYCMGRIGDKGGYDYGNCRFITQRQNQAERKLNGGSRIAGDKCIAIKGKPFRVVSPDGQIYEGKNITQFCRDHNLSAFSMMRLCFGHDEQYKGWTGGYQ